MHSCEQLIISVHTNGTAFLSATAVPRSAPTASAVINEPFFGAVTLIECFQVWV
jgi:hypothetical protein